MGKVIRCNTWITQAKEKVNRAVSIPLPKARESPQHVIATSTTPRDRDTSEESWEQSSTTPEETAPSSKSISETLINTKSKLSTSWQPRALTQASTSFAAEKPLSQLATYSLSTKSQREQPSATSNHRLEIRENTQDVQAPTPPSSVTLTTDLRPESDCPQAPERLFLETAELQSASLLVEVETRSPSWRRVFCSTNSRDRERDSPESLVSEWIPSTIPTEVVTTSTWVSPEPSADTPQLVRKWV